MIFELLFVGLSAVFCYVAGIAIRNYKAHQIFENSKPSLPEVPDKKLFSGHLKILGDERAWKLVEDLHEKYGKSFGTFFGNKPVVSTVDLDLIKRIVLDDPKAHINRADPTIPLDEMDHNDLFVARDEQWHRIRRQFSPAFSAHKVNTPLVQSEIKRAMARFMDALEWRLDQASKNNKGGEDDFVELDVEDLFHRYGLDLVFTCFYKKPGLIDYRADKDEWRDSIYQASRTCLNPVLLNCVTFPILQPLSNWALMTFFPQRFMMNKIMTFLRSEYKNSLEDRRQMEQSNISREQFEKLEKVSLRDGRTIERNMMDSVLDRMAEGKLSEKEFLHSSFFMFMAANKTTADALAKIVFQLSLNQDVQDKLRASILEHGEESQYLNWVINESLRLFPPGLASCGREVTCDLKTDAGVVPKGAYVLVPVHKIHRLKEYWGPDADEFKPERFAEQDKFHPMQFIPFGAGIRYCPGKHFATRELQMLMSVLIPRFKFESSPNSDPVKVMNCFQSPGFVFTVNDFPTFVRYKRVEQVPAAC